MLVNTQGLHIHSGDTLAEHQLLSSIAKQTALVIVGTLRKQQNAGLGLLPYVQALTKGTEYLRDTLDLLIGIRLPKEMIARYFELAFEQVLMHYGDPYNPETVTLDFTADRLDEAEDEGDL